MMTMTTDTVPAAERLDRLAAMYFDGLPAFKAYHDLPTAERRAVLEWALELCDEAGEDRCGVLSRESIVEMLREGDDAEHIAYCAVMDALRVQPDADLPF
jgi:hypothetical protein